MTARSGLATQIGAPSTLLLVSLALNLFFVGVGAAYVVRHYFSAPPAATAIDRSPAARIERLAATLPAADAEKLRSAFHAQQATVDAAREGYLSAQDSIRRALRAEPFDPAAMRATMADTRAARQAFDLMLQGVVATAAEQMSVAGRNRLADWPSSRPTAEAKR
jgi:uncharacterized membrane protein